MGQIKCSTAWRELDTNCALVVSDRLVVCNNDRLVTMTACTVICHFQAQRIIFGHGGPFLAGKW
jgi:hypothetical protein